jgi:hypothetical protein
VYKKGINPLIAKIATIHKDINFNLLELSRNLRYMNINTLFIFSIHKSVTKTTEVFELEENNFALYYIEISTINFAHHLKNDTPNPILGNFKKYNSKSLYIFRDSNYIDIKNIFKNIEGNETNLGRGGIQKAHMVSPLEYRMFSYLMAISNMDYNIFYSLNMFDFIEKERYLLYPPK